MGLFVGLMTIGNKRGQHAPSMVKKNVGHKCGSQRIWMTMSKFCHYRMILMLWQVSMMMWLKLGKTSFTVWLQIQGVTISLFMGILFFFVFQLKLIVYILTSLNKLFTSTLLVLILMLKWIMNKVYIHIIKSWESNLVVMTICDKNFLKFHILHSN